MNPDSVSFVKRAPLPPWNIRRLLYLRADPRPGFVIEAFDLDTGRFIPMAELGPETRIGGYGQLSVSPDGRWILYPQDDGKGSDLVLVDDPG